MRYLYGDSTAFPLNQNFIDTAAAATDTAVALLKVDELLQGAKRTSNETNAAADAELADIDMLTQHVEKALADRSQLSKATGKVAEEVLRASKAHFERARQGIKSWREATCRKAQRGTGPIAIMEPLHRFVVRHELPYTSWGLRWKAGHGDEPVQAQVYAIMQRGLTATIAVAIPTRHLWAQPVKVAQLNMTLAIKMMGKNWLGREKMVDENLDKYYVTRITRTTEREAIVLSKKARDPSASLRITFREGDNKRLTVQRLDESDQAASEPAVLGGADAEQVRRLWTEIKRTVGDLVGRRSKLLAATLNGKSILELDSPATVAVAIIQSVAPLVRDMLRHSRTPGELQLKRDLGDGRREELFISHAEVVRKWSELSTNGRQLFDVYGLSRTRTSSEHASEPAPSQRQLDAPASQRVPETQPFPSSIPAPRASEAPMSELGAQRREQLQQEQAREERRREAVRRAADAVREAARRGSGSLLNSEPAPLSVSASSFPPNSLSNSSFPAVAVQVPASSTEPSFPAPPRVPDELQAEKQARALPTPSSPPPRRPRSEAPPAPGAQVFQLPPPSSPPSRRASERPPPPKRANLRVVVNG